MGRTFSVDKYTRWLRALTELAESMDVSRKEAIAHAQREMTIRVREGRLLVEKVRTRVQEIVGKQA